MIEISDHADALGLRSPNSKTRSGDSIDNEGMSAENLMWTQMRTLAPQPTIKLADPTRTAANIRAKMGAEYCQKLIKALEETHAP